MQPPPTFGFCCFLSENPAQSSDPFVGKGQYVAVSLLLAKCEKRQLFTTNLDK